jgi:serine/threonine-protein kinase
MMSAEPRFAERARAAIRDGLAIDAPEAYLASALYKLNSNDAVSAATDLGTALVRAPMLAQAHEMAGRVLMELGALAESRQHLTNARSLDPLRAHLITSELARLDMLEGYTERAERAVTALANEPDRAMAQLGAIQQVRFAAWRGDLETARRGALMIAPRMGGFASRITSFVNEAVATGNLDEDAWQRIVPPIDDPELPTRSHLLALQILGEVALLLGRTELAYRTFEQANRIGLLDIANLDKCPLFDRIANEARFEALRGRVRERADRVLSAFRAALG